MKITVIQQLLPQYRIDVFNDLQSSLQEKGSCLSLLSTESPVSPMHFEHKTFRAYKKGVFWFTENLKPYLSDSDVLIVMWDIHWISLMLLPLFKKKNQKVIFWGHGISNSNNLIAKIPRKLTANLADALIFYDPIRRKKFAEDNEGLLRKSFVANNTVIVPNHGLSPQEGRTHFLYVGRINKNKQVDQLISAYYIYCQTMESPFPLTIVGGGELQQELKDKVQELKIGHLVHFTGAVYDEKLLKKLFASAICYVNPGTIGLGIVHAFAYGTAAIVCKDRRHGPEFSYCNESNSIIYSGDDTVLAEKLLYAHSHQESLFEMSKTAYSYFLDKLSVTNMLEGIQDAIQYVSDIK